MVEPMISLTATAAILEFLIPIFHD